MAYYLITFTPCESTIKINGHPYVKQEIRLDFDSKKQAMTWAKKRHDGIVQKYHGASFIKDYPCKIEIVRDYQL